MDTFSLLGHGFSVALTPTNLLYVFLGVLIGTVIGLLPGLGPTATIAVLLPFTYQVEPVTAIIMLAGIYYGSMYGGTITSVLLSLPGEAASVVTTFDGYQMAKQGRAGPALGIAAIGSFIGGTLAILMITLLAVPIARVALKVGPPEYTLLTFFGILLVAFLGTTSFPRSALMACVGLLLAVVGQDAITGTPRLTMGNLELLDGFDIVIIAMGVFGVGELLNTILSNDEASGALPKVGNVYPNRQDLRDSRGPIARGSVVGSIIGCIPGGSGLLSSLASYGLEKRVAKDPSRFGKGAIEGVAGPETANNAASQTSFVPLLTLGLPTNAVLALMLGALMVHGVTPGPTLIEDHPDIFWGVIASMYIGNVILLVLNLPLVGVFVMILRVRARVLASLTMVVVMLGVYTIQYSVFDMWLVLAFGLLGFWLKRAGFDPAPLVLAFILGDLMESAFRRSLLISNGSLSIFVQSPVLIIALVLTVVVFGYSRMRAVASARRAVRAMADHES